MNRFLSKFNKNILVLKSFLSGCWSGFLAAVIETPIELVKIIQQLETRRNVKMSSVFKEIINSKGIKGTYRGFFATFNRNVYAFGIYFASYEYLRNIGINRDIVSNLFLITIGGTAGVMSWLLTYPIDTIKTQIQVQKTEDRTITQYEAYNHIKNIYGIKGFFRGVYPCLLRAFLVNAVIFYTNEITHLYFGLKI